MAKAHILALQLPTSGLLPLRRMPCMLLHFIAWSSNCNRHQISLMAWSHNHADVTLNVNLNAHIAGPYQLHCMIDILLPLMAAPPSLHDER